MSRGVTLQQQKAAEIALESVLNGNKKTKKAIVMEAGYPEVIGRNPSKVFESEGFKNAIKELSAALNIDKDSRLLRLAQLFWTSKTVRDAVEVNKEISKMQGDYAPISVETKDFRKERENIFKPE